MHRYRVRGERSTGHTRSLRRSTRDQKEERDISICFGLGKISRQLHMASGACQVRPAGIHKRARRSFEIRVGNFRQFIFPPLESQSITAVRQLSRHHQDRSIPDRSKWSPVCARLIRYDSTCAHSAPNFGLDRVRIRHARPRCGGPSQGLFGCIETFKGP